MEKEQKGTIISVLTKDLTRETLYKLFIKSNTEIIGINDLDGIEGMGKPENLSITKNHDVRHLAEKLLFMSMLMDNDLENLIERRKNAKYDYMIGLLFYLSSNPRFKYGFGYFKECIFKFDKSLSDWCSFLNSIVSDIKGIGLISFAPDVIIQFGGVLQFEIKSNLIMDIKFNMVRYNELFEKKGYKYDFDIFVQNEGKSVIIASGVSDGSGEKSGLSSQISYLNNIYETLTTKNERFILLSHGH
ncbi:hypothetical protein [Muribaculum intestinale]|uniref:Uncharacterized protein n=2 Tax=Muribaculum intestinale TaxID=1796646 RepID=A0A4V3RTH9_9BACT|nr:hypothetical protein [Muribaculum intestinale]MYM13270.1 hypothetical protein [Muribaculum intestinale]TGY71149.1 hypothetical protein E5333_11800 [Muribaculum intestinale]